MTAEVLDLALPRAQRLKQATHALHERLDRSMMEQEPFRDADGYGAFVTLQYQFLATVEPVYRATRLAPHFAGLRGRSRLAAAERDLADLRRPLPDVEPVAIEPAEAVGWLYVSEGSTLGAAFLLKWAQALGFNETHGARHLAGAPEGRARSWRLFTGELDALALTVEEDAAAVAGAVAAFTHVQTLVDRAAR